MMRTSAPSLAGVDAGGILALVDALERDPRQDPHGLMILRGDAVIAAGWWEPYTPTRPQLVYSLSKSFTAAAVGVLVDDGLLDLDDPVLAHFPEFAADIDDERTRRMLVRHVATMASGHTREMVDAAWDADPDEPVRGFLRHRPDREPGSVFAYNQPTTYTLAAIAQRIAGRTLTELLRERVLGPIGAGGIAWDQWPPGRDVGFSGAHVTTDTIARLGLLLRRRGDWEGRRVLSPEWVDTATRAHIASRVPGGDDGAPDWGCGYGIQHWMSRHGYRGDGAFGQFCLVLPEHDLVVAYQGQTLDMQGTLDAVWEHLLPALGRPGDGDADSRLAARLAGARAPERDLVRIPDDRIDPAWDGARFTATGDGFAARVERCGDAWRLVLTGVTGQVAGTFTGRPGWTVTEDERPAVALSGGFGAAGTLGLDVAFVETPHRLHVDLDLPVRRAVTRWQTAPLHDPRDLRALRAPVSSP